MEKTASFSPSFRPLVGWLVQGLGRLLPFRAFLQNATSVPYTYLFRDVEEYRDALVEEWRKTCVPLQILNVGCATGQEAYSVGAVCLDAGIEFQIEGIDINSAAVEIARRGIYDWDLETRRARSNDDTPGVAAKTLEWMEALRAVFSKNGTRCPNSRDDGSPAAPAGASRPHPLRAIECGRVRYGSDVRLHHLPQDDLLPAPDDARESAPGDGKARTKRRS